ncbi:MAG: 1-deoxy-D-xylulose-5-phosphate reductoisomerase [Candidatus Omnitrophica bacterium]|nr:1-deoxy-D-xylulose-5-phosphate reductoisomerase [Candidatus Omnitrophota bacterium]
MKLKRIAILGSTGSIGTNALDVIRRNPEKFNVVGLAAKGNYRLLAQQARAFKVKRIAISDASHYSALKRLVPSGVKICSGVDAPSEIAALKEADMILAAMGGTSSILPVVSAINAKKHVALASKESLVSAGSIVSNLARRKGVEIIPVDSEHSAIFQCMKGEDQRFVKKIFLTGTGGPLRSIKKSSFDKLPFSRIINHPKWKMGRKISVDSATLMNKGLEVIEAKWLFDMPPEKINILLHPEAIIHSMVEFLDGTILGNFFYPDMRIPIFYALNYPMRYKNNLPTVDFFKIKSLTFEKPSFKKFPALQLAYESLRKGQSACAVLNAANEEAVSLYIDGKIKFTRIVDIVVKVLKKHRVIKKPTLKDILRLDKWAKEEARCLY